ncbi:hypothetical protein [Ascidiimonas aurantiaca]|uniref:hypothetical protein n=1 Tax=Ascidiimonas aurantiaca TaxID=1685432 RepID=UPI0030ED5B83
MISPEQRKVLKKVLKGDYIKDVKKRLKAKGMFTQKESEYSDKMISHVFNGRYHNEAIEWAILQVYKERKKHLENWEKEKHRALGLLTPKKTDSNEAILKGLGSGSSATKNQQSDENDKA